MEKLEIKDICITYHTLDGETQAVKNLNLTIKNGEFISIVGPSGCGKSTILSAIAGLIPISSGEITLDKDIIAP
ncbi:MAG: ATP-binding cassette domain-containing protein, partial [Clostridium sp.]